MSSLEKLRFQIAAVLVEFAAFLRPASTAPTLDANGLTLDRGFPASATTVPSASSARTAPRIFWPTSVAPPGLLAFRHTFRHAVQHALQTQLPCADMTDKVLENRLRRAAERRGLELQKSRRRDAAAPDFGRYMIVDSRTGVTLAGDRPGPYSLSLAEAARVLGERRRPPGAGIAPTWTAGLRELLGPAENLVAELRLAGVSENDKSEGGKVLRAQLKWIEIMRRGLDAIEAEDPAVFYNPQRA
jgi:hypothetical protein